MGDETMTRQFVPSVIGVLGVYAQVITPAVGQFPGTSHGDEAHIEPITQQPSGKPWQKRRKYIHVSGVTGVAPRAFR